MCNHHRPTRQIVWQWRQASHCWQCISHVRQQIQARTRQGSTVVGCICSGWRRRTHLPKRARWHLGCGPLARRMLASLNNLKSSKMHTTACRIAVCQQRWQLDMPSLSKALANYKKFVLHTHASMTAVTRYRTLSSRHTSTVGAPCASFVNSRCQRAAHARLRGWRFLSEIQCCLEGELGAAAHPNVCCVASKVVPRVTPAQETLWLEIHV